MAKPKTGLVDAYSRLISPDQGDQGEKGHAADNAREGSPKPTKDEKKDKRGLAWNMFFNFIKVEVNRFGRGLVERGYHYPIVQEAMHTLEGLLGPYTGTGMDVMAAVINNPEAVKTWVRKVFGAAAGDKINEIIDEFIDELIEKLRDLWIAHGRNVPPAELEKLSKTRASQPILSFSDALLRIEEGKRRRLIALLHSLETAGDPSERTRFAFYRPRLNNVKALLALLDAAESTAPPDTAKLRMFQHLETVYGEYRRSAFDGAKELVKKAGAVAAEKAKIVVGNPRVEIPRLTRRVRRLRADLDAQTEQLNERLRKL